MGRVISTAIQFLDGFTKPSQEVINSMRKMGKESIAAGKQIQNAGKSIASVGSSLTKSITLPIVAVAAAALKTSNDFENAMAKIGTIADTTTTPMAKLKEQVIDLSNTMGVSVTEIAGAQYEAISSGVATAKSAEFVATAIKAAKGGFTDTGTAVDGLTTVLNAYGLKATEATNISDQMLIAQNYGKTTFGDMASSLGSVIPIASSLNVSTKELFSSVAVLTNNGIGTSEAMTGLKAAYSNILKPTDAAAKTAQSLGMNFSAAHLKSVGWAKFLEEIKEKTGGNSETMAKLFGSTEALNSVMVLAGKGSAGFTEALKQMNGASGSTEAAYEKMLTPAEKMNISINKVKNSLIKFGTALTPVFNKVADIIGAVGDKLNNLSEGQVNTIVKFAAIAATIGPILMIFGKLVSVTGAVKIGFGSALKSIAGFKGVIGLIASPAGIVIGVLAAIAVAAFLIIKNWDKIKPALMNVGNWFKNVFEKAGFSVEGFRKIFSSIGQTIQTIANKIIGIVKMIAGVFIKDFFGDTSNAAPKMNETFTKITAGAIKAFELITKAVDKGLKVFSSLLDFFTGAFQGNWNSAAAGFRESLKKLFPSNIANGLIKAFNFILPAIGAGVGAIKGLIKSWVDYIKAQIENVKTIFKGIGQFVKAVFTGDWKGALEGLKTIASGALSGLITIIKQPFAAIGNMVKGAIDNFKKMNIIKNIFNAMGNAVKKVLTSCGVNMDKFKADVTNIKNRVGSIINNLKTIFGAVFGFIGKVVKAAATVVAGIFGKKISSTCSTAGAVVTAFKAVIGAAFNAIASRIKAVMAVIVPVVKVAFSAIKGGIVAAIKSITSVISGLMTVFDGITTFISGVFTGNWSKAWQGIKTIFKGVFDSLAALCKAPINAVIGIINGAIGGINKLDLTIPDWVPLIGGKGFNINVPTIPMLYKGTDNWRGGAAMIHDRGAEVVDLPRGSRVYPHDKSIQMARKEGAKSSGGIQITIQKLADKIEIRSDEDIDRIAEALALKLKKVALNIA